MLTALTSKLVFVKRLCIQQHQNMVHEIIRSVSISSKLKNVVSEKQETNGVLDTYERAIATLNSLQSNASTMAQSVALRQHNMVCTQIQQTQKYLIRSGMDYSDLDSLSVIHVAGTKGKVRMCWIFYSIRMSISDFRDRHLHSPIQYWIPLVSLRASSHRHIWFMLLKGFESMANRCPRNCLLNTSGKCIIPSINTKWVCVLGVM